MKVKGLILLLISAIMLWASTSMAQMWGSDDYENPVTGNYEPRLVTIAPNTGAGTVVALYTGQPGGVDDSIYALAYDETNGILHGVSYYLPCYLVTIDTTTAVVTLIGGPLTTIEEPEIVFGGAFDINTGTYYASVVNESLGTSRLITIDTTTGVETVIGPMGNYMVWGLAYDPNTDTLYGSHAVAGDCRLVTIDTDTGEATPVGPTAAGLIGLEFTSLLYGSDGDEFYTVNATTGAAALVGAYGGDILAVFDLASYYCPHDGDVNEDGDLTPQDAMMAFQYYIGSIVLNDCQQDHADVCSPLDPGSDITPMDALCIFTAYMGGLDPQEPLPCGVCSVTN